MKIIHLTQGLTTVVDDDTYEKFNHLQWYLSRGYVSHIFRTPAGKQRMCRLHRIIMNAQEGEIVHHKDEDKLNNQKSNLVIIDSQSEHASRHNLVYGPIKGSYRGVSFEKRSQLWRAQIWINGKHKHVGYFDHEIDAAKAWDRVAREAFGPDCYQNFPQTT